MKTSPENKKLCLSHNNYLALLWKLESLNQACQKAVFYGPCYLLFTLRREGNQNPAVMVKCERAFLVCSIRAGGEQKKVKVRY